MKSKTKENMKALNDESNTNFTSQSKRFYSKFLKRPMDFVLSMIAIIVLSPVLFLVALLVWINLGRPLLFHQKRPGLYEKIFSMYKFRTMTNEEDENGALLPDGMRLTKFGKMLRASSLDELPELFNIFKGDMSIVGPRPLLIQYLPLYNQLQRRRHEVRPGLSGYAQVNGRNGISWAEKFELDVAYIDSISFLGDWKIIFLTLKKVFLREAISQEGEATMKYFTGNEEELK